MTAPRYDGFVPGRHTIEAYGAGGFRFAEMSHRGSILALPSGVHAWKVASTAEITEESLAPLFAEPAGSVALLILGTGRSLLPVKSTLRARLRAAGIGVDPMATGSAVSTYNILLGEGRLVAAALVAA